MTKRRLTAQLLNSQMDAGKYYDDGGNGLFIHVKKSGSKAWAQRIRYNGKQQELGLGKYPEVSLALARKAAADNKALTAQGINPKIEKSKPSKLSTFAEVANEVIPIQQESLTNHKHREQWRSTIESYAFPYIGQKPINEISVNDIHDLLLPIWKTKTETASRLRGRVEKVFDYAIVKQLMPPPNPATWQGNLSALLPPKSKVSVVSHHPALRLKDVQRWWAELKQRDGNGALALKMLTLCASRSGEIRGMHWDEIELFSHSKAQEIGYLGIWTCPANRMKANRDHRIPIIQPMLDLIMHNESKSGLVFPSRNNTAVSDMTLSAVMKRMHQADDRGFLDSDNKRPAVPHGIRSTFRNWVAETGQSREAAELQLAHKFGSKVEHAYYRTDLLDLRAQMLTEWFNFLEAETDA